MPQNFVKSLDTASPSVVLNEKTYDTSAVQLAEVFDAAATQFAEAKKQKDDIESASNFNADLADAEAAIETLRDQHDLARLEALRIRNEALGDTDTSNDEIAKKQFNQQMERINLREQQQGIILDSNKRALIRKWTTIRPDLADHFKSSLAINEIVSKMKSESSAAASKQFSAYDELVAKAIAQNTTVALLQNEQSALRTAAIAKSDLEAKVAQGGLVQTDFNIAAKAAIDAELSVAMNDIIMPIIMDGASGNFMAPAALTRTLGELGTRLTSVIYDQQKRFESKNGVVVSTDELRTYVSNFVKNYDGILSVGDIASMRNFQLALEKREAGNAFAAFIPWLPPAIAAEIGPNLLVNAFKDMPQWLKILQDPKKGLPILASGEFQGNPQAQAGMMYMRLMSEQMARVFEGSTLSQNDEAVQIMNAYFTYMSTGQPLPPEVAVLANPILNKMFAGAAGDVRLPADQRSRAEQGLIKNTIASYDSMWGQGNIMNPNSEGARKLQTLPSVDYEQQLEPLAAIVREKVDAVDPDLLGAITYNPTAKTNPFGVDPSLVTAVAGRADTLARGNRFVMDAVNELNKMFATRAATRTGTTLAAHTWATSFYNQYLKQPENATSNTLNVNTNMSDLELAELDKIINGNR